MKTLRKIGKILLLILAGVIALPILLLVAAILLLLSPLPVGVRFRYSDAVSLQVIIAFFRKTILPKKPKTRKQLEKEKKKKAAKAEKKAAKKAEKKKKQKADSLIAKPPAPPKPKKPLRDRIEGLLPWAKLGVRFVGEFFGRRLCIRRLNIRAALAGGDPAKLALNTAKAWEAIGMTIPVLEQGFRIKEKRIAVYPDFTADKTDLEADAYIRLRVGGVVWMLVRYGFKALGVLLRAKLGKKKTLEDAPAEEQAPKLPSGDESGRESA